MASMLTGRFSSARRTPARSLSSLKGSLAEPLDLMTQGHDQFGHFEGGKNARDRAGIRDGGAPDGPRPPDGNRSPGINGTTERAMHLTSGVDENGRGPRGWR